MPIAIFGLMIVKEIEDPQLPSQSPHEDDSLRPEESTALDTYGGLAGERPSWSGSVFGSRGSSSTTPSPELRGWILPQEHKVPQDREAEYSGRSQRTMVGPSSCRG